MALLNLSVPPWLGFESPDSVGALLPTHLHGSQVGAGSCPASSEYTQRSALLAAVCRCCLSLLLLLNIK